MARSCGSIKVRPHLGVGEVGKKVSTTTDLSAQPYVLQRVPPEKNRGKQRSRDYASRLGGGTVILPGRDRHRVAK